jgi:hypothetical protein
MNPVVLLEFNELCPSLMEEFISQGHLPNFKKLRDSSSTYITKAEEPQNLLEPWIQWVNIHTGVPYSEHGISQLGENDKIKQPAVWDLLSDAGKNVWVCGSMNVNCSPSIKGAVLPDPWSRDAVIKPAAMQTFYDFVKKQVQEHSNASASFGMSDYVKFLAFMVSHGLTVSTVSTIIKQLSGERKEGKKWRRAFILDLLTFDVFASVYKKEHPAFSTLFLNSTAHMQHVYWRNMQPELFVLQPTDAEQKEYSSAILEGYIHMDKLVGSILELVGPNTTLMFATALSQQPFLRYEAAGGKRIYRPTDIPAFAKWAGIQNLKGSNPVMAEQFWLEFDNPAQVDAAAARLDAILINGEPAVKIIKEGNSIFCGFSVRSKLEKDARLSSPDSTVPFFDIFYEIEGLKSGMHHPEGMLWVRDQQFPPASYQQRVPLEAVAPTILDMFSVNVPAHMHSPSLLAHEAATTLQPA